MNLPTFAVRVSEFVKQFPLLHKGLRRAYCLFHPGIRFHVEETFRCQRDIFVLKIGANDGMTNDPIGDYLLSDSRYHGVLVEPVPHYARMLAHNFAPTGRFSIEQVAVSQSSGETKVYYVAENAADLLGKYFDVPAMRGIAQFRSKPPAQTFGAGISQHRRKLHGRMFNDERVAKAQSNQTDRLVTYRCRRT